ncbi:MAG: DUF4406 domain-containing protein [Oscillospiraceae bacterium]|nr:DUF4406 domain-containing protein [Oscillospiraceae bacterium]
MDICKFNSEGYYDPTAYEALLAVEREAKKKPYRPLVFICSPLAGDIENNIANARRYSKFAMEQGMIPFAPHLLFPQFMDDGDKEQRSLGIFFGLVMMGKCDDMWVFGDPPSCGMKLEIAKARKRGIHIRYFNENCQERSGDNIGYTS